MRRLHKSAGSFEYKQLHILTRVDKCTINGCNHIFFLSYEWDNNKDTLCFIMFNPSYADVNESDRTTSKLINRFKDKYGKLKILNLFTEVSFHPKYIKEARVTTNNKDILKHLKEEQNIVFAWGSISKKLKNAQRKAINKKINNLHRALKHKNLLQLCSDKQAHPLIRKYLNIHPLGKLVEF